MSSFMHLMAYKIPPHTKHFYLSSNNFTKLNIAIYTVFSLGYFKQAQEIEQESGTPIMNEADYVR